MINFEELYETYIEKCMQSETLKRFSYKDFVLILEENLEDLIKVDNDTTMMITFGDVYLACTKESKEFEITIVTKSEYELFTSLDSQILRQVNDGRN